MPAFVVVRHDSDVVGIVARLLDGDRRRLASIGPYDARRNRFLAGRSALFAAAARLGESDIRIDARCPDCGAAHGRPTAQGTAEPLHLALAHAGDTAFAIASRHPVGIDAEHLSVSEDRRAAIDAIAPGRGDPLRRWTAIEAVLKADGRGLRLSPDAVRVGMRGARFDGSRYRLTTAHARECLVTVAERRR